MDGRTFLKNEITKYITNLFDNTLSYCEVAVPSQRQYKILRSRILKAGNDTIRVLHKVIDENYDVKRLVKGMEVFDIKGE